MVFHANTMRVKDVKKAAKLEGEITQQSADLGRDIPTECESRGVDVESARSAGLIPPVNIAVVRAFADHKPLVPSAGHRTGRRTLGTASQTLNARLGFPYDAVNREPQRGEAAGRQVGCGFLRVWSLVRSCKFRSAPRCS
jgi:hypothetical protein